MKSVLMRFVVLAGWLFALLAHAQTPDYVLFGPTQYNRTAGAPNVYSGSFSVPASAGAPFQLRIVNGAANGQNRITSGWVKVNGVQVVGAADFGPNVALIERNLTLSPGNTLEVAGERAGRLHHAQRPRHAHSSGAGLPAPNPLSITAGALGPHGDALAVPDAGRGAVDFQRQCSRCDCSGNGRLRRRAKHRPDSGDRRCRWHHHRDRQRQRRLGERRGERDARAADRHSARPRHACPHAGLERRAHRDDLGRAGRRHHGRSLEQRFQHRFGSGFRQRPRWTAQRADRRRGAFSGDAQVTASLNGSSASSQVRVTPAPPTVVSLLPAVSTVTLGAGTTLTLTISSAQSADTVVRRWRFRPQAWSRRRACRRAGGAAHGRRADGTLAMARPASPRA